MSKKIYKFANSLGGIIAILIMFSPIVILSQIDKTSGSFFWLLCSILYDIYMYSIIKKVNYIEETKQRYYKYMKNIDEALPSLKLSDKEKLKNTQDFIEDFFEIIEK